MKLIKSILTITAVSSLIACSGGGGGGGSGDDNGANENESNLISNQSVDTTLSEETESSSVSGSASANSVSPLSGNTASGNTVPLTNNSTNQSAPINQASFAKVDNTAEIVSNDSFMFKSSTKVAIDIIVPSNLNKTDYLTVCLGDEATAFVDYSQCLLKTPITNLQFTGELTLKNDTQSLALVLLDYDHPNSPHVSFWNRLDNPTLISL
jgi:hypothetical protein